MPIQNAPIGPTKPEAGVMVASPAMVPVTRPMRLGFPKRTHSMPSHTNEAVAAARGVPVVQPVDAARRTAARKSGRKSRKFLIAQGALAAGRPLHVRDNPPLGIPRKSLHVGDRGAVIVIHVEPNALPFGLGARQIRRDRVARLLVADDAASETRAVERSGGDFVNTLRHPDNLLGRGLAVPELGKRRCGGRYDRCEVDRIVGSSSPNRGAVRHFPH